MKTHVVGEGENIWRISSQYRVSVKEIVDANKLDNPNILTIGQALSIPAAGDVHIVRPGETLWTIARKHGISIGELINENRLSNLELVYPGTTLRIPKHDMEV